jgi:hypothetical protein
VQQDRTAVGGIGRPDVADEGDVSRVDDDPLGNRLRHLLLHVDHSPDTLAALLPQVVTL